MPKIKTWEKQYPNIAPRPKPSSRFAWDPGTQTIVFQPKARLAALTLAHEIAHWKLKHPRETRHLPVELMKEEIEAWEEAAQYLSSDDKQRLARRAKAGLKSYMAQLSEEEAAELKEWLKARRENDLKREDF